MESTPARPFYLNGGFVGGDSAVEVVNPWTGGPVARVCLAGAAEVEAAVACAQRAFDGARRMSARKRSAVLEKTAGLIAARRVGFVDTIVAEAGKPVVLAEAEVDRAAATFRFAAALALSDGGHGVALDASAPGEGHFGFVRRFPIGVILGITPFNFPLNLVAHKVAPCLATGNTMVLKPSLKTPMTALLLAEVLHEAGVPAGQINVLPFEHTLVGPLLTDPRMKMLSFTGSVDVGWRLKGMAARQKVALELGGNAAVVVEPDCDWRAAVPLIAAAAYGFAGQSCISVQRILVNRDILPVFREALVAYIVEHIHTGDPSSRGTLVGPMIDGAARGRILEWIGKAVGAGAGTPVPVRCAGASVLEPVLLEDVPAGFAVLEGEAFAPVAVLQGYDTFDEALRLVNSSVFGLQAGVFTNDISKALRAHEEIEVGGVMVNQVPTFRVENMPYGGVKASGTGREGVGYAMDEMTEQRLLVIRRE